MKTSRVAAYALGCACLVVGASWAQEIRDQPFELPMEVISAATAFESYMNGAAQLSGRFADGAAVHNGLKTAVAYEPGQFEEGMIAYGAIAALQDDRFVDAVQDAAGRGEARRAFAERLIEDPFEATHIDGAAGAARRVDAAIGARAAPLISAGAQVKNAAYQVQHQAWSKAMVADAQGRLAEVKTLSAIRAQPSESDNQAMMVRVATAAAGASEDAPSGYSAIEARSLALAAESVLGYAHGADRDRLSPLLTETASAQCLRMAKLNLYQCMAVAGPQYEDIFCLGQHAMYDTGACVDHAARGGAATVAQASRGPVDRVSYTPLAAHHTLAPDPN